MPLPAPKHFFPSQPKVNAAPSDDADVGWGGAGGFVFQKAYVEFFVSPALFARLLPAFARHPTLTYHAINAAGGCWCTCVDFGRWDGQLGWSGVYVLSGPLPHPLFPVGVLACWAVDSPLGEGRCRRLHPPIRNSRFLPVMCWGYAAHTGLARP